MHRTFASATALMLLAGIAHAGIDNAGTTAGNFLSVGTGASVLSMGGATLGQGNDLNAAAWNPAALAKLEGTQFSIAHGSLADQQAQEWAAAGGRFGRANTRWSITGLYQGENGFDGRDAFGQSTGSFGVSNLALGVAFAQAVGDHVAVGFGTKYVNESLGTTSGSAIAFDAGVQARAGAFGFGLAARNLGGQMKYDTGAYDLPSNIGVGLAWQHPTSGVRLALDANFPSAYYNDVRMGAEWRWQDRVAVRTGYRMELGADASNQVGGPTFGMGTGVNGLWLDYGFLSGGNGAESQHRLGLSFRPSQLAAAAGGLAARPTAQAEPSVAAPKKSPKVHEKPAKPANDALAAEPKAEKVRPAKSRTTKPQPAPAAVQPLASDATAETAAPAAKPEKLSKQERREAAEAAALAARAAEPKPAKTKKSKVRAEEPAAPVAAIALPAGLADGAASVPAPRTKTPSKKALEASKRVAPVERAKVEPEAPVAVKAEPETPAPAAPQPVAVVTPPAPVAVAPTPAPAVVTPTPAPAPPPTAVRPDKIVVRSGETLADLAKRWDTSVTRLMMENNLVSETVKPGRSLKLPPAGAR